VVEEVDGDVAMLVRGQTVLHGGPGKLPDDVSLLANLDMFLSAATDCSMF
jgi:hypothetical protein